MRTLKIVEPEALYAFAKREGLLAQPDQPPPAAVEQTLPAVEVCTRQGKLCELAPSVARTNLSFKLRFDEALVWGGPLAIVHGDHLLAGGFCHQSVWVNDGAGHSNLTGTVQLPDFSQADVPLEHPKIAGYCSHWGHFFTDTLDRLLAHADAREAHSSFLADAKPVCANALDLLFHAGILRGPLELHPLKANILYRARNLEIFTLTSRKPSAPVSSLLRLREALAPRMSQQRSGSRGTLYVGRSQVALRRIAGQAALAAQLEAADTADVFYPELHPVDEAIGAFSGHDTIVMPIGSAKFNLTFCRRGTRVVCITPRGYAESNGGVCQLLRHMCAALDLRLSFYSCASVPSQGARAHMLLHHDLKIDASDLDAILSRG